MGVIGYLLGGGLGWNADHWSVMACQNVTKAEIMLASGERVVADRRRHPDLFWAARGAGPCFPGLVTKLHIQLFPRPAVIRKSEYTFRIGAILNVVAWLGGLEEEISDRIELSLTLVAALNAGSGGAVEKLCVITVIAFADTDQHAACLEEPFARTVSSEHLLSRQEALPRSFPMLLDEMKGEPIFRREVETVWSDDP